MTKHVLKTWPEYFQAVWDRRKTFEIRKNDRNFNVGDVLVLREYDNAKGENSGREIYAEVTYMTTYGQPEGQVVLGIKHIE